MQPNTQTPQQPEQQANSPNQNPYTIDYLNQIAPKEKKPFFDKKMKILAAFLAIALLGGIFMLFSGGNKNETGNESVLRLYLRVQSTNELAKKYQNKIKNSQLNAINSGLTSSLSSEETKIKARMDALKIVVPKTNKDKTPPKIISEVKEESDKLDKVLDDAFLNAVFDRTYSREMNYRIEIIKNSIKTIKLKDKTKTTAEVLDKVSDNLTVSIKQISEYQKTDN